MEFTKEGETHMVHEIRAVISHEEAIEQKSAADFHAAVNDYFEFC